MNSRGAVLDSLRNRANVFHTKHGQGREMMLGPTAALKA
jgi:hypothetical protein